MTSETALLAALFLLVASLYGSVGQAGASGYLGVMALVGVAPERMKPTALLLNVVVASLATWNFRRTGSFYPGRVLPLAVGSVPLAFVGGAVHATSPLYRPLVGIVLAVAAVLLLTRRGAAAEGDDGEPRVPVLAAVPIGGAIGVLAGLTGTGGGTFLTPLLLFFGWASVRQSAGLSAPFILLNSVAALAGSAAAAPTATAELAVLAVAAGIGGFAGSWLGANRIPERPLSVVLAVVLAIAAAKLAFT